MDGGPDLDVIEVGSDAGNGHPDSKGIRIFGVVVALVATAALVTTAVATARLVQQGRERNCVDRSNALAGLEALNEPDGRSSQRLAAQRYASCYGVTSAPPNAQETVQPVMRCPNTEHAFERAPTEGESGDGLPASNTATRAAAERIVERQPATRKARVIAVNGRAWRTDPEGKVIISPEVIYTVEVQVRDKGDCPHAPATEGSVPMVFVYPLD